MTSLLLSTLHSDKRHPKKRCAEHAGQVYPGLELTLQYMLAMDRLNSQYIFFIFASAPTLIWLVGQECEQLSAYIISKNNVCYKFIADSKLQLAFRTLAIAYIIEAKHTESLLTDQIDSYYDVAEFRNTTGAAL